jgi:hypothetical protein
MQNAALSAYLLGLEDKYQIHLTLTSIGGGIARFTATFVYPRNGEPARGAFVTQGAKYEAIAEVPLDSPLFHAAEKMRVTWPHKVEPYMTFKYLCEM